MVRLRHINFKSLIHFILFSVMCLFSVSFSQNEMIVPGGDWRDTDGKIIAATEGGVIKIGDYFYLWGMDRSADNYAFVGVNLYKSKDLKNWTFVNQILKKTTHADLNNNAVIERAKILYNSKTGKCVMWMHFEGQNAYKIAEVAYATCDSISGNYTFVKHFRPMDVDSRDINVYQDDDGKGYLICTTEGNQSVTLFELDETYTSVVKQIYRGYASSDMECEGHAIIRTGGYYFWLMSWCTGWDFNDNHYFYSSSLAGPWKSGGNIAVSNTHTYESQVGFAVTVKGSDKTTFLYTGDRWTVNNYGASRIVLLPIEVSGTALKVNWYDQWDIDAKTGLWSAGSGNFSDGIYSITAKHSGLALGTDGSAVQQQTFTGAANQLWRIQNLGASHFKITSVESGKVFDVNGASKDAGAKILQYAWSDAYNQKWQIIDCGDGFHRFVSVNTLGKSIEIANSVKTAGTDAVLGTYAYKDNQMWKIAYVNSNVVSGKSYMIVNKTSGKALDISAAGSIIQSAQTRTSGQVWKALDLYNGCFTFSASANSAVLDNAGSSQNGSQISTGTSDKRFSQQWQLVNVKDKYFKLVNRYSGKVIDNKDGSTADGSAIIQYTDNASSNENQQWEFVLTDIVGINQSHSVKGKTRQTVSNDYEIYDLRGCAVSKNCELNKIKKGSGISAGLFIVRSKNRSSVKTGYYMAD